VDIVSKEELESLYWDQNLSIHSIASKLGISKTTVHRLMKKYGIPRRSFKEAQINRAKNELSLNNYGLITIDQVLDLLKDKVPMVSYKAIPREDIYLPLPLKILKSTKKSNITLTLVISDLHLGHEAHLPETYWSCINTCYDILEFLTSKYDIIKFRIVCNGDIVTGKGVYKFQIFDNLVQRGHWQVFLGEQVLRKTITALSKIKPISNLYLIKGTHESIADNAMLYLKKCIDIAKYCSKHLLLNIADPVGHYNVLFTHGYGRSSYYPFSYELIRDLWKTVNDYRFRNILVERIITGHNHWLTPDLELEGLKLSQTGGFQKWPYTIQQRPPGLLLLLYGEEECSVIPIRPNKKILETELLDHTLEYKNMLYYGTILKEHYSEEAS